MKTYEQLERKGEHENRDEDRRNSQQDKTTPQPSEDRQVYVNTVKYNAQLRENIEEKYSEQTNIYI